jgi:hypothetical protein
MNTYQRLHYDLQGDVQVFEKNVTYRKSAYICTTTEFVIGYASVYMIVQNYCVSLCIVVHIPRNLTHRILSYSALHFSVCFSLSLMWLLGEYLAAV